MRAEHMGPSPIVKVRHINYERSRDLIEVRSGWDNYALKYVREAVERGDRHELVPVVGWGEATHRLSFTGGSEILIGPFDGSEILGYDFLAVVR